MRSGSFGGTLCPCGCCASGTSTLDSCDPPVFDELVSLSKPSLNSLMPFLAVPGLFDLLSTLPAGLPAI